MGPLDGYANDIVECWFPAKRMLSSYSGAAGRLRETSGSTENDISFAADGYWDTAAATSFLAGAGGVFRKIYGQKGMANLDQATAADQPVYLSAFSGFNNRVAVHLNTGSKGMPSNLVIARPYSILLVEDDDDGALSLRTITSYTGTGTFVNNLICGNRTGLSCFRGGSISTVASSAPCVQVLTGPSSGNHVFYRNATNITTGSQASGDWEKLAIGKAPNGAEGALTKLAGVIVFNKALSGAEVTALQTILTPGAL